MKITGKFILKWMLAAVVSVAVALVFSWTIGTYIINDNASDYFYTVNADGVSCTVTGVKNGVGGGSRGLYIPDEIDGYIVTAIGDEAFMNNENVTDVRFPETVTSIGARAFKNCNSIKKLIIPDTVSYLGDGAVEDCKNITYVHLHDGITLIPNNFAKGCDKLTSIVIPITVTRIGTDALAGCNKALRVLYSSHSGYWQKVEAEDKESINPFVFYYSRVKPIASGKYWYYGNNGNICEWKYKQS